MPKGMVLFTDGSLTARSTVHSGDLKKAIGIDFEGSLELSLAARHRRNSIQLEFTQKAVVLALCTLSLIYREGDGRLVVLDGSENTSLVRGDGGITRNDNSKYVTLHGHTQGERCDI